MKIPQKPPDRAFFDLDPEDLARLSRQRIEADVGGRYLHWDELRRRRAPEGLSHEIWWLGIALARRSLGRMLPVQDIHGAPFFVGLPDSAQRLIYRIDQQAAGRIGMAEPILDPVDRDRYLVSSLIEEAITSSQLEGASTTRRVAADMLRRGRRPRTHAERMILSNYRAMEHVREILHRPLSPALVLELHRVAVGDTLDATDIGRLRLPDEDIVVSDAGDGTILHQPPAAASLPDRLMALCDFANEKTPDFFVHPIVRAILVHFWLAYDHPFVDGNGRVARLLYYWSALKSGYWLLQYVSISSVLRAAPARYNRAFLFSETDNNDATYFVVHQLEVIDRALAKLAAYVRRKSEQLAASRRQLATMDELNHRQSTLVAHALRHPDAVYTIAGHQRSHRVVYQTARTDLLDLAERGLVDKGRRGRAFVFRPAKDLNDRF